MKHVTSPVFVLFGREEIKEAQRPNQQKTQAPNAVRIASNVAHDAKAVRKIAAQAASGNVVGAAVTTVTNPRILKSIVAIILSFFLLLTCCLYAVPNMVWEATQNVVGQVEDVVESTENNIYYVFYGSGDGHEGLTGVLQTLGDNFNPFEITVGFARAGWEIIMNGEVSDETMDTLPDIVQGVIDSIYSDESKYYDEVGATLYYTDAGESGEGIDLSGGVQPFSSGTKGMTVAYQMKRSATEKRIQGRTDDINSDISKDAEIKFDASGCDSLSVTRTFPDGRDTSAILLSLFTAQSGASLDGVTLQEYCNWLGISKQGILDRGLGENRYEYVPELLPGNSYGENEVGWDESLQHWGGEFMPFDIYQEFDYLADAAADVESQKDFHYTINDRYDTRQKVMNGKYEMDSSYSYPELCTSEAYDEKYSQVWYNSQKDKYYDRGALDVCLYPSPKIHKEIETYEVTNDEGETETRTRLCLTYTVKTFETEGEWWTDETEQILTDILKFPIPPFTGEDENSSSETEDAADNATAEYTIEPRAVLLNSPESGGTSKTASLGVPIEPVWDLKYLRDLIDTTIIEFGSGSTINSIGAGGGGGSMVQVALSQIGERESGGSNNCKYTQWYNGVGLPWCAIFICWCADQCGYLDSGLFPRTAHSATFWNYVLQNPSAGSLYTPADVRAGTVTPMPGDILIVSGANNQEASSNTVRADDSGSGTRHVALVTGYDPASQRVATVDGNISDSVSENSYSITTGDSSGRKIWGFVRPAYPNSGQEIPGGEAHQVNGLDMDTDGSTDPADMDDPYYQPTTSITTADGAYYDASKVNYTVVAKGHTSLLGCLVTIKDEQSGKVINCIAADSGPRSDDWNEVSVCAARSLGYNVSGLVGVNATNRFTITYYPDCKLTLYASGHESINDQIDAQAKAYRSTVADDGYTPDFDASNESGRID